jgi:transcriptional regulator with XRE-family HTH domain
LSQSTLGQAIGLTFQQVQKYERGANRVSSSRLFDLSKILDVPIVYFFSEMPEGIVGSSPARLHGAKPPAMDREEEPMHRRETLELVRAYYLIKDPGLRKRFADMVRAISRSTNNDEVG